MKTKKELYDLLIEHLPPLMESNINDDIEYLPEEDLEAYADDILYEINHERSAGHPVYSKEKMDKLEEICTYIKYHVG